MAMMDRIRERLQGQRPVGAAQQAMPMGTRMPDIRGEQQDGMNEEDFDMMTAPERTEVAEARRLGAQMGAESIMQSTIIIASIFFILLSPF